MGSLVALSLSHFYPSERVCSRFISRYLSCCSLIKKKNSNNNHRIYLILPLSRIKPGGHTHQSSRFAKSTRWQSSCTCAVHIQLNGQGAEHPSHLLSSRQRSKMLCLYLCTVLLVCLLTGTGGSHSHVDYYPFLKQHQGTVTKFRQDTITLSPSNAELFL